MSYEEETKKGELRHKRIIYLNTESYTSSVIAATAELDIAIAAYSYVLACNWHML